MTHEQTGDTNPSFEELVKRQLDPLYQREAAKQRLLEDVGNVAASAEETIDRQRFQEFVNKQGELWGALGKFGIEEKLRHIKGAVWKQGVIHAVKEPFVIDGENTEYQLQVGYRLAYHCPAVVEIDGETNLRETMASYKSRARKEYFPISETQVIEIRVANISSPGIISIGSFSRLNIPDEFRKHEFNPIIDPEWLDECFVTPYVGGVDLKEVLAPISFNQVFHVPRYENPKITLVRMRGYEDHTRHAVLRSDSVDAFDEFLVQDCAERFQRVKLPQQTREFWLKYIQASNLYFNQYSKEHWLRYIQLPDSDSLFVEKIRNFKLPTIMRHGYNRSMSNVTLNYADSPGSQLTEEEQTGFKTEFKKMNGIDFDDVVEWLRGAKHVGYILDYARLDKMFNKLNANLQTNPNDQQLLLKRDQVAIALMEFRVWAK